MSQLRRNAGLVALSLIGLMVSSGRVLSDEIQPEFVMFLDPQLDFVPPIRELDESLLSLWRQVLLRPEAEYQRQAAEAIAHAAESGFPGMDAAREDLQTLLTTTAHPTARFAAAHALIAIDARSSADALYELSQKHDSQLRLLVEPALAAWEYKPIQDIWRSRLRDRSTNRRELLLAMEGLAVFEDEDSVEALVDLVLDGDRPSNVRLVAARAAGTIADHGLEPSVDQLLSLDDPGVLHRLCAVALLRNQSSETARNQLLLLARDADPTVVEQALGRMNEIDPELVIPLAEAARINPDPKVRRRAADAYVALVTPERVEILSQMLNDLHPDVRTSIRDDLFQLATRPELDDAVRAAAMSILESDGWQGQEQSALLLAALDHKPAAERLIELLRSQRMEVLIAAGWALRVLAIEDTLPAMLEHARYQTTERIAGRAIGGVDHQVAHLFEAMGQMNYLPAEDLMREYIPKNPIYGIHVRRGDLVLGHFHAGDDDEQLAAQFAGRMNDTASMPPDFVPVFMTSALSLGRMRAQSQLPALYARFEMTHPNDQIAYAVRWAIHEITGEEFADPEPIIRGRSGWFLEPIPEELPTEPASE